jgi:hypothetical protein
VRPRKLVTDLAFQEQVLHHQGPHGKCFLYHSEYFIFAKWFDEVVEGSLLHSRHSGGDIAMTRHHHNGNARLLGFYLA